MSGQRALPDFIIIGAQKSGTTSLYAYLTSHPRVAPARRKEVHFFDQAWGQGVDWYRSFFPLTSELAPDRITGEATPYLLFHPHCPERVQSVVPDAKLVVILRDPVARTYSHYRHEVGLDVESLAFTEALDRERERLSNRDDWFAHQHFSYVARGEYVVQLRRWFDHFDRRQFVITLAEDLFADPARVTNEVLAFLGQGPVTRDTWPVYLPSGQIREETRDEERADETESTAEDESMGAEVEARLRLHFRPFNQELAALLGRDLPWDRPASGPVPTVAGP